MTRRNIRTDRMLVTMSKQGELVEIKATVKNIEAVVSYASGGIKGLRITADYDLATSGEEKRKQTVVFSVPLNASHFWVGDEIVVSISKAPPYAPLGDWESEGGALDGN